MSLRRKPFEAEVDDNKLVAFLYVLMRDHVTTGTVEEIMLNHVEKNPGRRAIYSSYHLAAIAADIADRLQ